MEPKDFLNLLLKKLGTNPTAVAEAVSARFADKGINVDQATLQRFVSGKTHTMRTERMKAIASHLKFDWNALHDADAAEAEAIRLKLVADDGSIHPLPAGRKLRMAASPAPMKRPSGETDRPAVNVGGAFSGFTGFTGPGADATNPMTAPVVLWSELGDKLYTEEFELHAGERLAVPRRVSSSCKWVEAQEDLPRFGIRKGHYVALEPNLSGHQFIDDDLYLFRTRAGKFFLAEYRALASDEGFEAIPNSGPPLDKLRHGIDVVARHVATWKT